MNDKYVEEKARELHGEDFNLDEYEDFIRTIVKDCKPKVSKEWIGTLIDLCVDYDGRERRIEDIYEWLKEAGVEVEE